MPLPQGSNFGVYSANVPHNPGDYYLRSVAQVTASTTQTQAGGTPLLNEVNQVASAHAADAVTLPTASPGMVVTVLLSTSSNTCKVFPAVGDTINALSKDAAITMSALTRAQFVCVAPLQWWTLPLLPS
jgi:hypothetical protein